MILSSPIATKFEARPRKGRAFFVSCAASFGAAPSAVVLAALPLAAFEAPPATPPATPVVAPVVVPAITCPAGETASVVTELFLGREAGGRRVVTPARWSDFLAREVTPRFPDGLTVYDASGQWRDETGRITREASKVLLILSPAQEPSAGATSAGQGRAEKIVAIVDAYKRRFRQKSVLVLTRPACARF